VAARRLLIVLVLLLAASVVAAALAPDRTTQLPDSESSSTTISTTSTAAEPIGEALSVRIDASAQKPETVEAFAGDQLALSVGVAAEPGRTITIEPLGLSEFAAPEAPAHFNLLLREAGRLPITDEHGAVVGRIEVEESAGPGGRGGDT
jgi:hypothetical protein